ncbi:DMT family transporter [Natrialba taiwanensis]|uniref:Dmt(Drug/metabolite transporter) superfamily permease n=1 Tax=Natrialba taiwanensis DSM 12281 TaxID=1230458 RepID=M0ADH6_9EURY|nr:DMT family transporter [Natrialba taiwanensis]ELY96446.1 dmt(drug/metabolite transporter) superfamily permease [Natrialba taiwanensis DSM 12281]
MAPSTKRTLVCFVIASLCFGGTYVAAKAGLSYFPPLLFVAFRFDIGALLLLGYVLHRFPRSELLPRTRADIASILAAGVFAIGLANAFIFIGQQFTTSAVSSIMYSLNPILTPVFATVMLADEEISKYGVGGLLLGLVGVTLVVNLDPTNIFSGAVVGKAIVLTGAISGALGSILIRSADASLPSTVRTAWAVPVGAVLCHSLSLVTGEKAAAVAWTPTALIALGYLGVFSGAIAFIAYFSLLDDIGAIRGNLIFYVVPVVATLGGWVLLGETISAWTFAGFLVIFAGFALIGRGPLLTELTRVHQSLTEKHTGRHSRDG